MNRGVDHKAVFFADVDRIEFERRLASIHAELAVTTLAYCLMGNHFHLLLRSPPGALPVAMQRLTGLYTRHTNDRVGRDGPLFRGRYHSIPVETDAYLLQASRYIHRNPLVLPGVSSPRHYRWSSYRAYLGLRRRPTFLDVGPATSLLGGRRGTVAAFTEHDEHGPDRSGPTMTSMPTSIDDVRLLVGCAIAVDDLTHPAGDIARQSLERTVVVLLADRARDARLRSILAAEMGARSAAAAAAASRRARLRFDTDPMVRRVVAWVEAEVAVGTRPAGATRCA